MKIYIVSFYRDYHSEHAMFSFSSIEKAKTYAYKHGYSEEKNGCYIGSGETISIYELVLDDEITDYKYIPPEGGVDS